jgi:hypothetical protein
MTNLTERELIIQLYGQVQSLREDIIEIKQTLRDHPYPSEKCQINETAIAKLQYRNQIMAWAFGAVLAIIGMIVYVIWR